MKTLELYELLKFPKNIIENAKSYIDAHTFDDCLDEIFNMTDITLAEKSYLQLKSLFKDDENGFKMLTAQLLAGTKTYDNYKKIGIDEKIFIDTFSAFLRFCNESVVRYNKFFFDRHWWTYRFTGMTIFRLGELEYEMITYNKEKTISIHIPSDADLTPFKIDASLLKAKEFFARFYPEYKNAKYLCESWLISPTLKEILPENSKIISFLNRFEIFKHDKKDTGFTEWVFNVPIVKDINTLPENTSLQKKCKKLLLEGKSIGAGYGYIKNI